MAVRKDPADNGLLFNLATEAEMARQPEAESEMARRVEAATEGWRAEPKPQAKAGGKCW